MKFPKKARPKNIQVVTAGKEPANIDFTQESVASLISAYNYYNQVSSQKEAKDFIERRYKNIQWDMVPSSRRINTYAWVFKMIAKGCIFPANLLSDIDLHFAQLTEDYPKIKRSSVPQSTKIVSKWDKQYIADFDDIEDSLFSGVPLKELFFTFKSFASSWTRAASAEMIELISLRKEELESKDKEIRESYSYLTAKQKREILSFYQDCINFIEYIPEAKKILKPRKPRVVPVEKKLKSLKFQKTNSELGLSSIQPEKLLGAKVLWVFNSKYRDLIKYESTDGFDLKGTTLQNVSSSKRKKVRKPEILKGFFTSTKARMDKEFDALTTKASESPGRINEDTLIMRVF